MNMVIVDRNGLDPVKPARVCGINCGILTGVQQGGREHLAPARFPGMGQIDAR
jgi:hypothetical protein